MNKDTLIEIIKDKNVDVDGFVSKVFKDKVLREEIVHQLLTNPHIMVYYHCYYIISKSCAFKPELFYVHWDDFAKLLHHQNSYHRDIGLTLIGHLTKVDTHHFFDTVLNDYLSRLKDPKFMTAQCCVQNIEKILRARKDLIDPIIDVLLQIDDDPFYPPKQNALLGYDVLVVLDAAYASYYHKEMIHSFIKASKNSLSPKTKKKAVQLIKKYQL